MKKIAIVSLGYLWFPCEPGTSRFYQIANTFINSGYDVECITTSFQHFQKKKRDENKILSQGYPFEITFIDVPSYKKNVDIRRVYSNLLAARNIRTYLSSKIAAYDAVYCSIPANNIAATVSKICKQNNVPCIIDIEDLWPEAMSMVVNNPLAKKVLLKGFDADAEEAYKNASAIVGTSEDYTMRAFKKRSKDIPYETVYVGCNIEDFDKGVLEFVDKIEKPENEFWVTYAGSISNSYDIKTLIMAAKSLLENGHADIKIQILGTGSLKEEMENLKISENIQNVSFWGFTEYHKMAAALVQSDVVVNSFVKGAPQSIVNKIGDYLTSGKPIINTLENPVFCKLINQNGVGVNIEPENIEELVNAILQLKSDDDRRVKMGENARELAEKRFDRKKAYKDIVELIEKCMEIQKS